MEALILAGGLGSRLRPLVADRPKPMADISGKPFLSYQLDWLRNEGIKKIVIAVCYKAEQIITHFGTGRAFGVEIHYSIERNPLGTGGAIKNAASYLTGRFFIVNGDTYFPIPLEKLIAKHEKNNALLTIALCRAQNTLEAGKVKITPEGMINLFYEKKEDGEGLINAGIYLCESQVLSLIPEGVVSWEKDVIPSLVAKKQVYGQVFDHDFFEIGTPENYLNAKEKLKLP